MTPRELMKMLEEENLTLVSKEIGKMAKCPEDEKLKLGMSLMVRACLGELFNAVNARIEANG